MTLSEPFGNYVLLERVAIGGMAELFRAESLIGQTFPTEICIKRILPHYSEDDAFIRMFIDEATIAAKLDHDNIVRIYDFDMVEDCYYIAMELVHGRDLKQTLELCGTRGTRLTVPMVAQITAEVCRALDYAHKKVVDGRPLNIIHRDVSPHNVLVSFGGEVKITDFGIAKAASRLTTTRAGTVKGKCAYMSPEQARGKSLDPRSDLFSIGIIMHEMLTGRRLFSGESDFDILTKVLKEPISPPGQLVEGIDPEIDRICMRALERDRDDRYPDCAAMERDLMQWLRNRGYSAEYIGLGTFMQALYGLIQAPLPQTGAPIIEPDMSEIASMATAMFDRPDFDEGPAAAQPGRTMPLESMDVNDLQDPVLRQQIEERHRASLGPDGPRMIVPAPGGQMALAPDEKTAMFSVMGADPHAAPTMGISVTPEDEARYRATPPAGQAAVRATGPQRAAGRSAAAAPAAKPKGKLGLILALVAVIGLFLLAVLGAGGWYLATKTAHLDGLLGRGPVAEATPAEGGEGGEGGEEDGPGGQKELEEQQEEDPGAQEVVKEPGGGEEPGGEEVAGGEEQGGEEVAGEEKGGGEEPGGEEKGGEEVAAAGEEKGGEEKGGEALEAGSRSTDKPALSAEEREAQRKKWEEARKKREESAGSAFVTINAYPWANVTLDGKDLGRTPVRAHKVSAGSHTVVLKNPDFKAPFKTRIKVKKDEKKTVFHNFK